jgi:hypothetical protein
LCPVTDFRAVTPRIPSRPTRPSDAILIRPMSDGAARSQGFLTNGLRNGVERRVVERGRWSAEVRNQRAVKVFDTRPELPKSAEDRGEQRPSVDSPTGRRGVLRLDETRSTPWSEIAPNARWRTLLPRRRWAAMRLEWDRIQTRANGLVWPR